MHKSKLILWTCVLVVYAMVVRAQTSNQRCVTVLSSSEITLVDSLLIDPESIMLNPRVSYVFDQSIQKITVTDSLPTELEVCYRVLQIPISKVYQHKSPSLYDSSAVYYSVYSRTPSVFRQEELFDTPNIHKSGSLTRGVNFGNTQGVNVNSSFNFQMDGQLTDKLNIRADLTDQNIPFQPEGNTQQLREFDHVSIEVYNDDLSILAGDVLLRHTDSYFLKYNKNVLGGKIDVNYDLANDLTARSMFAISAAKGQFADITIQAQEGLPGPYQFIGANGEQYSVIMANSEQVYLDGQLLQRGFDYDYVIDYNLGELTFTPRILITQFSRIRVTFEYSDQSYSRSIMAMRQELIGRRFSLAVDFYREKDDLNRPLSFTLTQEDQRRMSEAGDDDLPVPISSAVQVPFSAQRVLYIKKDTLDATGNFQEIFQYSRDSSQALFQVSFAEVGLGRGDYELVENDVNGRVYQWISPQLGQSVGSYSPVQFVAAPNMRQMMTIGGSVGVTEYLELYTETAVSNHDLNLYSIVGNKDNNDLATKAGLRISDQPVGASGYKWYGDLSLEYDGADFRPIDRYRPIEYDRDWSYDPQQDTFRTSDHIFTISNLLKKDQNNALSTTLTTRKKENVIDGWQQDHRLKQSFGSLKLAGSWFGMENQSLSDQSTWRRWGSEAFFDRYFIVPGYQLNTDRNAVYASHTDSLLRTAMNYQSHTYYLRNHDTLRYHYRIEHVIRTDRHAKEGRLSDYSRSKTSTASLGTLTDASQVLGLIMTHREIRYDSDLDDENFIQGRLDWRSEYWQRHLEMELMYATSSSREILREFVYVPVAPGEGTHTWRDLNDDGVQDLTEFFPAINFDERNYIKIFVPTQESIDAFNTLFTYTLRGKMPRKWSDSYGIKRFLSLWSNRTNININKKNTDNKFSSRFNPFALSIDDQFLIFTRDGIRSSMFYNQTGRGLGGEFAYAMNRSKQAISQGIESRWAREYRVGIRYHLGDEVTLTGHLARQLREHRSQFQIDRNFDILTREVGPGVIWQPTNNLRLATSYKYIQRVNQSDNDEWSQTDELNLEGRWSQGVQNSLTAQYIFSDIDFKGNEQSASGYELLNALRPGANSAWRLQFNQKLVSGLQMSLGYEGRKSTGSPIIHMGTMQVTALF